MKSPWHDATSDVYLALIILIRQLPADLWWSMDERQRWVTAFTGVLDCAVTPTPMIPSPAGREGIVEGILSAEDLGLLQAPGDDVVISTTVPLAVPSLIGTVIEIIRELGTPVYIDDLWLLVRQRWTQGTHAGLKDALRRHFQGDHPVLCKVAPQTYGLEGRDVAAARHSSRPRHKIAVEQRKVPNSKETRWQQKQVAQGKCPHCGKDCAPYAECEEQRRQRQDRREAKKGRFASIHDTIAQESKTGNPWPGLTQASSNGRMESYDTQH